MNATSTWIWQRIVKAQSSTTANVRLRTRPPGIITVMFARLAMNVASSGELTTTVNSQSAGRASAKRRSWCRHPMSIAPSSVLRQLGERQFGDAFLLCREQRVASGEAGLRPEPLDDHRSAVDASYEPGALEHREVTSNRFGGDLEFLGERGDVDTADEAGTPNDLLMSFLSKHGCPRHIPVSPRVNPFELVRIRLPLFRTRQL